MIIDAHFRHTISSGTWTRYNLTRHSIQPLDMDRLSSCNPMEAYNIRDALAMWMICRNNGNRLVFTEPCYTPHCNPTCPDEYRLVTDDRNEYPLWARVVVIVWVVGVTVVSILTKLVLYLWEKLLFQKQKHYLEVLVCQDDHEQQDGVPEVKHILMLQ